MAGLGQAWLRLNQAARRSYRRLLAIHPGTAQVLRRMLGPVLLAGNRAILHREAAAAPRIARNAQWDNPGYPGAPLRVSVIVPNFNHAEYLHQRLDTIFGQSRPPDQVILLDDASTDGSRTILQDYAARYPDVTQLVVNDRNSGGVFRQWEKGLALATGDLVWIAESDDWAAPDFLAQLVPHFDNPGVMLAFAPSRFMDGAGKAQIGSMQERFGDLPGLDWTAPFTLPAAELVAKGFAQRNLIPNASSALMRRPADPAVLRPDLWRDMQVCGDWAVYLQRMQGGLVSYDPGTHSYFRVHQGSTARSSWAGDGFYAEHAQVAAIAARLYPVPDHALTELRAALDHHWLAHRGKADRARLAELFDPARIAALPKGPPRLLMIGSGFSTGGAELFPIHLANMMQGQGYSVTWLDAAMEDAQPGIRAMLSPDIPVLTGLDLLGPILDSFGIEVIHSHHAWVDAAVAEALEGRNPRPGFVVTLHGMYEALPEASQSRIIPQIAAKADRFVSIAAKNEAPFDRLGLRDGADFSRIPNALGGRGAAAHAPLSRGMLDLPEDAFVLVLASRARAEKGWAEAIEAVGLARQTTGRDIRLILLGDGPEAERLGRHRPDHVLMPGFRADVAQWFALADAAILPSRFAGESVPLMVIEALQAGRPVIATRVGDIPDMLATPDGHAGRLIDLHQGRVPVAELAVAIGDLAANPAVMQELTGRVPVASRRFDPAAMIAAYDSVYRALRP